MKPKKIYVIGGVTGIPNDNRPAFERSARALHDALGCEVEIPHDTINPGTAWDEAMHLSLSRMMTADGVAAMEGWQRSRGAQIEYQLAYLLSEHGLIELKTVSEWLDDAPKVA